MRKKKSGSHTRIDFLTAFAMLITLEMTRNGYFVSTTVSK